LVKKQNTGGKIVYLSGEAVVRFDLPGERGKNNQLDVVPWRTPLENSKEEKKQEH